MGLFKVRGREKTNNSRRMLRRGRMSLSLLCHHLSHNSGERDGMMERRNIAYSYIQPITCVHALMQKLP